jgi:hypothetical protein
MFHRKYHGRIKNGLKNAWWFLGALDIYRLNFACTIVTPKEKYDSRLKFRPIETSHEAYYNVRVSWEHEI